MWCLPYITFWTPMYLWLAKLHLLILIYAIFPVSIIFSLKMRNLKKSQSISSHHNNLASLLPFRNCDTLGKNPVFYPLWDTFANPRKCFPETHSKYSAEPDFLSSLFFLFHQFLVSRRNCVWSSQSSWSTVDALELPLWEPWIKIRIALLTPEPKPEPLLFYETICILNF